MRSQKSLQVATRQCAASQLALARQWLAVAAAWEAAPRGHIWQGVWQLDCGGVCGGAAASFAAAGALSKQLAAAEVAAAEQEAGDHGHENADGGHDGNSNKLRLL